jgi:hypothetical protein
MGNFETYKDWLALSLFKIVTCRVGTDDLDQCPLVIFFHEPHSAFRASLFRKFPHPGQSIVGFILVCHHVHHVTSSVMVEMKQVVQLLKGPMDS